MLPACIDDSVHNSAVAPARVESQLQFREDTFGDPSAITSTSHRNVDVPSTTSTTCRGAADYFDYLLMPRQLVRLLADTLSASSTTSRGAVHYFDYSTSRRAGLALSTTLRNRSRLVGLHQQNCCGSPGESDGYNHQMASDVLINFQLRRDSTR